MTTELIQGSPEWLAARLGSFGGSILGSIMAKGEGKTRAKAIRQLAAERICGRPQGFGGNEATEEGHRQEPLAVAAYTKRFNVFVEPVGLIRHPTLKNAHASPDGLIGDEGGLEIKSHVKFITHIEAISGNAKTAHVYQCQWGMACTGRLWWEYGHFCEEAPEHLRLFMFPRIERDNALIAQLVAAVQMAELEVQELVALWSQPVKAAA